LRDGGEYARVNEGGFDTKTGGQPHVCERERDTQGQNATRKMKIYQPSQPLVGWAREEGVKRGKKERPKKGKTKKRYRPDFTR